MLTNKNSSREFPVNINSDYGYGTLLVTDLAVMLKPAPIDQYHKQTPHDIAFMAQIMDLGDYDEGYGISWHISTDFSAENAHQLMHQSWYAYFDGYCLGKTWIDADVYYVGAEGKPLFSMGYGFSDGDMQGAVFVYTNEFWQSVKGQPIKEGGNIVQVNWTPLLKLCGFVDDDVNESILLEELEELLSKRLPHTSGGKKMVLVQPSSDEIGYTARGFEI